MFHDRRANTKLNKVCERALRIACKDSGSNSVNKSLTIHQRNSQLLAIEIFKTKNNINPTFMKDVFAENITIIACVIQIICNCRKQEQQFMVQKIFSLEVAPYGPHCPIV